MSVIFVSGTDTGIGKTVVTGLLGRYLLERGHSVVTQKWVETGAGADIETHLRFMRKGWGDYKGLHRAMRPYELKFASSPHLAARLERRRIDGGAIKRHLRSLSGRFDFVIVEGAGGLLVPLGGKRLFIDLARELGLPVLLVAGNRLGAINHALLSVEALKAREMRIIGIIFNAVSQAEKKKIAEDNPKTVARLSGVPVLGTLPRIKDLYRLRKVFAPIGERIRKRL